MSTNAVKYVIISPVRDEEANLARTIESVISQSLRPCEWMIVNDGSTDRTAAIADSYARQHDWIRVCHRDNRGFRKAGGGVVDAFNDGYLNLRANDWSFIVKLDGDLSFVVAHLTLFVEPSGEFLDDRVRRTQQFVAPHHLSDHEVAEELSEVVEDVLGAEEVERLLIPA